MKTLQKAEPKSKADILLLDDHPSARHGLKSLVKDAPDMRVCGEADDLEQAMRLMERIQPSLVLVNLSLWKGIGLSLTRQIRSRFADLPILILTMHDEIHLAERALQAGANGYLTRKEGLDILVTAIRQILKGRIYVSDDIRQAILQEIRGGKSSQSYIIELSDRELEIFHMIGHGYGNRQIAEMLDLSEKTVDTHRTNMKRKLHSKDYEALQEQADQWVRKGLSP